MTVDIPPPQRRRPLDFLWFLPTSGDGAHLGSAIGRRAGSNRYLREIAQAADRLGYLGVLIPTGRGCEDAWITAASIVTHTERLKFLVALRPGVTSPGESARQAAAFDRLSGGRLLLNVVAGGNPADLAGDGIFLSHDERYEQAAEFLHIWRGLMQGQEVNFEGRHLRIKGGRLVFPPLQAPHPPLYIGGSSPPAHQLAAEQTDLYLTWGEPPAQVAEKIADVRRRADAVGRSLRFGIRLHLIVRETDEAAWAAADGLIAHLSDEVIAAAQHKLTAESDSVGQRRMVALHGGDRSKLEVSPNLMGGRRAGPRRGGHGPGRLAGDGEGTHRRISRARHRHHRRLRLSAPGGSLPRGRIAVSVARPVNQARRSGRGGPGRDLCRRRRTLGVRTRVRAGPLISKTRSAQSKPKIAQRLTKPMSAGERGRRADAFGHLAGPGLLGEVLLALEGGDRLVVARKGVQFTVGRVGFTVRYRRDSATRSARRSWPVRRRCVRPWRSGCRAASCSPSRWEAKFG